MILSKSFLMQQAEKRNISEYGTKKEQILFENVELSTRYDSVNNMKVREYDIFLSFLLRHFAILQLISSHLLHYNDHCLFENLVV